jgi:hypothetical protein
MNKCLTQNVIVVRKCWKKDRRRFCSSGNRFSEYRMMGKVPNPRNSKCCTPSAEPFRIFRF